MNFESVQFFLFFLMVVCVLFFMHKRARLWWLLVCNYYFYMCWNPKSALLLAFVTLCTYSAGRFLETAEGEKRKKWIVAGCCLASFSFLFVFKYFNFLIDSLNGLLKMAGNGNVIGLRLDLLLPIGISFYTFQAVGYVIDVYRGEKAEHHLIKYAVFVSFFPQLGSGPIERGKNILGQLEALKTKKLWNYDRIKDGALLMLWGLFQKIILADRLALFVDEVFGNYQQYGLLVIGTALVLYAFQIYCDFDGYTNIACGVAQIMGITLMQNFKRPYFATNIKDFWNRWHISLTSWFRDYLYIPLGGNRKGTFRKYLNVFIVFCVSGLWHGASWNFVIWGALHGLMLVGYQMISSQRRKGRPANRAPERMSFSTRLRNGIVTFAVVDFAWFFFRTASIQEAFGILRQMTRALGDFSAVLEVLGDGDRNLLIVGLFILFIVDLAHEKGVCIRNWVKEQEIWFRYLLYIGVISACIFLKIHTEMDGVRQFIYFRF